jgi:cytochrome c551/c552
MVGDAFAGELNDRGLNARSFAVAKTTSGCMVAYQVGANGIGPQSADIAAANIGEAIKMSRARDDLLYSQ